MLKNSEEEGNARGLRGQGPQHAPSRAVQAALRGAAGAYGRRLPVLGRISPGK